MDNVSQVITIKTTHMTATQPQVTPTGRYSVSDTATHLGLSTRTVQRHIKDGTIRAQTRKLNSKRFVTGTEIIRVWNQTY